MRVTIKKMGINGEGIGYIDRLPVFVPGALLNEEAEIKVTERTQRYARAKVEKIIKRSEKRVKPPCAIQHRCGACPYMVCEYAEQLRFKRDNLRQSLIKYAQIDPKLIAPVQPSPAQLHYRNQFKLPVGMQEGKLVNGMYMPNSNIFVPMETCLIHEEGLEAMRKAILEESAAQAERLKAGILDEARRQADQILEQARRTAENEGRTILAEVRAAVADEIVDFSNFCLDAGADAVMILPPYYFHFGADALLQYYDRLAQQIHGNIYIYNFPDNTGYTIPPATVLALAKIHLNIVGMKDTVSGMDHTRELIKVVKSQIPQFEIYSGFDDNFAHNVLSGGNGCIGALSNVVPEICSAWVRAFRDNDLAGIARGQQIIDRLMDLYAVRSPFLPVIKEACRLRGIASTSVGTFPMPSATVEDDARILELLNREGIQ